MAWKDIIKLPLVAGQTLYNLKPKWDAEVRAAPMGGVRARTADDITNRRPGMWLNAWEYDLLLYSDPLGDRENRVQPDKSTADVADNGVAKLLLNSSPASYPAAVEIDVDVILIPYLNPSDDSLPLSLVNYAGTGIVAGALAWLASQAGKPWYSAGLFAVEEEKFKSSTVLALIDEQRGGRNQPIIQRPPEHF